MSFPILDILTADEIHEALVAKVLQRHNVAMTPGDVMAQVVHRKIQQNDGTWVMISSVAILGPSVRSPVTDGAKIDG